MPCNAVQCNAVQHNVIKWKHFPRYWPFVQGIHQSPVNSPHKGQWCEALIFSLICVWINGWVNNREAGDLRCYHAHYDVIVMVQYILQFLTISCHWRVLSSLHAIFIRPFEKRDVLCRGNVRPSVCLSVCLSVLPSVRPRFPDFSSTCFEISIWNLVYTFSRWHDMSSLSCITIGSFWPSLQPKVGQTHFLQSWPHKSR